MLEDELEEITRRGIDDLTKTSILACLKIEGIDVFRKD